MKLLIHGIGFAVDHSHALAHRDACVSNHMGEKSRADGDKGGGSGQAPGSLAGRREATANERLWSPRGPCSREYLRTGSPSRLWSVRAISAVKASRARISPRSEVFFSAALGSSSGRSATLRDL
jgi:hypothetical protein